jgi:hypothetical protein
VKVTLAGEAFDYDASKQPMSEALAIEHVYKRRYAQWQQDLGEGSAEAFCVLAWVIWRRDGRDIPYQDILDGTADFDLLELLTSVNASAVQAAAEEQEEAGPTTGDPAPDGTPGTAAGTSASSPSTSRSARGK